MEDETLRKVQKVLDRPAQINEVEVRSLMNLIRKQLELEPEPSRYTRAYARGT